MNYEIGPVPVSAFVYASAFALISIAFMFVAKLVVDRITPYNDDVEVREKFNLAVALRSGGIYAAVAIGMAGALQGPSAGFENDVREFAIDGFVVIAMLLVCKAVLHLLTLRAIKPTAEVAKGNVAVGLLECCSYLATGLILNGAFTDVGGTLLGAVIYALLGQVALAVTFLIYEAITPWSVTSEIANGNRAAALFGGARMLALGMILQAALAGPMEDWATDLTAFGLFFVFGTLLLAVVGWLADLLFLPGQRIREAIVEQKNLAAIAKVAGVQLAVALVVATVM